MPFEIRKIYLDMDGVLADFDRGLRELCGLIPLPQDEERPPAVDEAMWAKVREVDHFYDRLEVLPGAKEMFDALYEKYGDRCEILTGIPKPRRGIHTSAEDKTNWIRRLISKDVVMNIVHREQKPQFCTGKDCVLIDDYGKNIEEWQANGGTGILFKSPEETLRTLEQLEEAV